MADAEGHLRSGDHVRRNREAWDGYAAGYAAAGERAWAAGEPTWGIFGSPESEVGLLPERLDGLRAVELGCGTAYVSAWLARRGARTVGLDGSSAQLATAARLQARHGLRFPLVHADAERAPLRGGSFDLAVSEYGAAIWCDPYRWIPEAARLLRPGGRLAFLGNASLLMLCVPDEDGAAAETWLRRPQRGMHRFEWPDDPAVEFHLSHGDMLRLLRASGFEVEDLVEVYPPEGATTRYPFVTREWAEQWPCEEVWKARKRG
ncbi:MAG: methyltransferase domain-containing protein [Acidimicrobiales bacterium]|nr:methyltransferase domain-containing protein [Acidimicrobiales bacterium]